MNNKRAVLITLMLGTSMAAIDSSIVNVSLPVIQKQFGASISNIEWVITAYMISFSLFIPLTNWLKTTIGYYNLFIGSVIIFTVGSLICSISGSLPMLIAARVLQATGGGAISPVSLAILSDTFPKEERGTAIGWWGIGNVMGPAIGPTLGGVLTHYFGWESIFYVNIPIGIITILLTIRYLSFLKVQANSKTHFDIKGYAFLGVFIVVLQYTVNLISRAGHVGWQFITGLGITAAALLLFIRSSKTDHPLIDLTVFRSPSFVNASVIILLRSLALYGGLFFLPFLLQGLLGFSEIQSGLLMLPNALMMLVTRPYAGKLADKGLVRNVSVTGIILISVSMALFSTINTYTPIWFIIFSMMVRGSGMSLLVSPVSTALLNSVDKTQTPTATVLNSLLQQTGGSVGIAISGIVHAYIYQHYLSKKYVSQLAQHFALQDGFLVSAFIIILALIPAFKLPKMKSIGRVDAAHA